MDAEFWGNTVRQWGLAGALVAGLLGGLHVARRVVVVRLASLASRTPNPFDDIAVQMIGRTRDFFLAIVALGVGESLLVVSAGTHAVLRVMAIVGIAIQVAIWGSTGITGILGVRVRQMQAEDPAGAATLGALGVVARLGLYAVVILLTLDNLGVNVSALVAGLGIGGVAIALATQNVLGDLFASLAIVLDKPFIIGDFIVVGDLMGSVEHVGLKTTRVRSLSGEQLVFANADLLSSRIRNFKRMAERRVSFTLGVAYQTPHARLAAMPDLIREVVSGEDGVRFDRAHFSRFDDSALTFEVVYIVLDPDYNRYMDVQQRINLQLFQRCELEGIEFAYPTRTVWVRAAPAEVAGGAV